MGCRRENRRQAPFPTAGGALRKRKARPEDIRLRRRRLLLPRAGPRQAQGRDAQLPRPRLHGGQEEDRRRLAGRGPAPHRFHPERARRRPETLRRRQRALRPRHRDPLRQGAVAVRPVLVRGTGRSAGLRTAGDPAQLLQEPDGHRRGPVLDAGRAQPDPLRRHAPGSRLPAVRLRPQLRPRRVPAHPRHAAGTRLERQPLHPPRRAPDVVEHRGRPGTGRQRVLPRPVPALRRLPRRREGGQRLRDPARPAGNRLRGQDRSVCADAGPVGFTRQPRTRTRRVRASRQRGDKPCRYCEPSAGFPAA